MENIFPQQLIDILIISVTLSMIIMVFLQKLKKCHILKRKWQVLILNLISSFAIGIPFSMNFYDLSINDSIWVSLFCFIGAPTIYEVLKNQTILTYKPTSLDNYVTIPKSNEIAIKNDSKENKSSV